MKNIGERLKQLRNDAGLTQSFVSNLIGITLRNYQYYEADQACPRIENLIALADYYEISLDDLVGRSDRFSD